ncbi:hypothetical protein CCMSSC00406_0008554 [Pleurotus cornucopiae]|uniref:Uncharacterized protein n=1 Tax=Pleurotus cornucopiae TaxID=5321 RepID=A0ACB7J395_PLECO|nr:hypothetical protein CCMSSC00406_0008554 [Pleurotus cornucopiae]
MDVHDRDFDELDELFDELTVDQLRHIDEIEALATSVPILPTALEVTPGTQIVRDTPTLDTGTSAEGSSSTALQHVSRLEKRTFEQLDTDNMLSASDSDASRTVKRPRGRPPGTKNSESRTSTSSKLPKRPVGRPKKQPQHLFASVPAKFKLHGLRVPSEAPARIAAARSLSDALRMPSSLPAATRTQAPALLDDGLHGLQTATSTLSSKHLPLSLPNSTATPPPPSPGDLFPAETQIIPDNDPSRLCSLPDDDDDDDSNPEAGFVDDGLGEEEDIDEGGEEALASDKGKKPHNRRLPPWLQGEFEHHLAESSKRASDGLPALYRDHQTFWFPRPATFFRLQEKSISPQILYNYQFFLWDPLPLVPGGIICPNKGCTERLWRHDHVRYPRRVVDLHSTFWIIGYRYRCPRCRHPEQVKFRSWDTRILAALPSALSAEFPAILTHRSGLSARTFNVMRSCFHNGVGTKQFSNTIRLQHLQKYDSLHLAYLQTIATRSSLPTYVTGERYKPFLPYDDRSEDGAHGFVPGAPWLRDLFDIFIEKHEHEFNQHTAMLSGTICAVDHSFKLTKHVAKVNGMQVFVALLTVTNEKGEIRICNLVATKAHSQFEVALHKMRESLTLYGHDQPSIFYTDSMADKDFLERCFPSLRSDTVPVEKYGHLPTLNIPEEVQIIPCKNRTSIDNAMRTIIDSLPSNFDDSPLSSIVIGLDSEWNVEISDRGYVTGRGQTAILQIAFDKSIGTMLTGGHLPDLLLQVLSNPHIIKVGRCVSADLRYLQQCCHNSKAKFTGAVDLGKYAKDCLLVPTARVSLSDLCAKVLSKSLNKNISERTSTFWEEETLTAQQLHYAALDAYASLLLYEHLSKTTVPTPLIGPLVAGDPILLYTSDRTRCAAEGTISPHASDVKYSGINITPTRTVIVITKVHIPAAFVLNGTSDKQQLASFGAVPFHVVCLRNHLRQSTNQVTHPEAPVESTQSLSAMESVSEAALTTVIPEISTADDDDNGDNFTNPVTRIGTMLLESLRSGVLPSSSQLPADNTVDPDSEAEGRQVIEECNSNASKWSSVIRSRVLKDPFHVLDMFYISVSHGLLHDFLLTLRDTIFIPDKVDKTRIIVWGSTQQPPVAWEELVARRAKWVWCRCKCIIPPPEELYPLVAAVFEKYGPLKDAKTHLPLFNSAAWAVAKNILELVQKGFISDPPCKGNLKMADSASLAEGESKDNE